MEKKEMSFLDKFEAAFEELGKAMEESNKNTMIMIAASEGNDDSCVSASIKGKSHKIAKLLAYVAINDKGFKEILTGAIKGVEAWEQRNNKYYGKERNELY